VPADENENLGNAGTAQENQTFVQLLAFGCITERKYSGNVFMIPDPKSV